MSRNQTSYYTPPNSGGFAGWLAKRQRVGTKYGGMSSTGSTLVTRRRTARRQRKSFARKVFNVFPAKHLTGSSNTAILNGRIYTMNLSCQIVQGTAGFQREGDSVQLEALKLEGHFQTSTVSNAYKFRLIVGYSGEEYGPTQFNTANLTDDQIFQPNTGIQVANGIVNPKAFTTVYDETIDLNSQIDGDATIHSLRCTIPLNKKFPYQSIGSAYGKSQNLYAVVVSNQVGGALDAANGSAFISYDLIFRD